MKDISIRRLSFIYLNIRRLCHFRSQNTVAFGTGLRPRYDPGFGVVPVNMVGADQKFSVQSFDIFGNVQDGLSTAADWTFTCVGGDPSPTTQTFIYNDAVGNATYTATYNVRRWHLFFSFAWCWFFLTAVVHAVSCPLAMTVLCR